ncbi:MAG: hypothetical protein P4L27_09970 [Ignavibacteriaceae bacterium]|nr:hypothetical protein [Ignavibacteriaceae bacterium]
MTGKIYNFDLKVGGGYQMSLFYPLSDKESRGKTSEKEDKFTARFVELTPNKKIVQAIYFLYLEFYLLRRDDNGGHI